MRQRGIFAAVRRPRSLIVWGMLAGAASLAGIGTGSAGASDACTGVNLQPGDDVAAAVATQPDGTTFCFAPGVYRITSTIVPGTGDTLIGEPGAALDGSRQLTGWTQSGSVWVLSGHAQGPTKAMAGWDTSDKLAYPQSKFADDLFYDNTALWKVGVHRKGRTIGQPASSVGPGQYFINYDNDTITLGSNPAGHLVEQAYAPLGISSKWPNVTISGLTVQKMQGDGIDINGDDWSISNSEVRLNHVVGVSVDDRSHIFGNFIHDNGEYGMTGHGADILIEQNTVSWNDYAKFSTPEGGCNGSGGSKFVSTLRLIVRDNDFVDNWCNGIWIDVNSLDALIENNRALRNRTDGIREEIGYNATIRGNQVFDNGRGGITVVDSQGTEISGNSIGRNLGTELILQQHYRVDPVSSLGPHEVHNTDVFGNEIWLTARQYVGARDTDEPRQYDVFNEWNNNYHDNTYHVGSATEKHWRWGDKLVTYPEWQALGHDPGRSLLIGL